MQVKFDNNIISLDDKKKNNGNNKALSFKGPLDGALTTAFMAVDTNPMVNAAFVDLVAMVAPRTYIDTKKRNKFAGFETFFREFSGTVILCFSAGPVAYGVAHLYNKFKDKNINIKPNLWATNSTFDTLKASWVKNGKNTERYVRDVFKNMSGVEGSNVAKWSNIKWNQVQWYDNSKWANIKWKNPKYGELIKNTKTEAGMVRVMKELIEDPNAHKKDINNVYNILEQRISNALGVSKSVDVNIGKHSLNAELKNVLRDTHDLGKHIFNTNMDLAKAETKLKAMNKVKSIWAVGILGLAGLSVQYINRYITKKRTGKDEFVGNTNFTGTPSENGKNGNNDNKSGLNLLKGLACAGIVGLAAAVMKIKNPADFMKRLEFKSIITSGNAIKSLYTVMIMGRFLASRDKNELRESTFRDYFAFLNWLVLGGFVSKLAAQKLFDPKKQTFFNITNAQKPVNGPLGGIKKWLNDTSLKSHLEIAAKGGPNVRKNVMKLSVAHAAGILYSIVALGLIIPLANIYMTNKKSQKNCKANPVNNNNIPNQTNNCQPDQRGVLEKIDTDSFANIYFSNANKNTKVPVKAGV